MRSDRFVLFFLLASFPLPAGCAWIDSVGKGGSSAELRLTSSEPTESARLKCPSEQFPIKFYYFDADEPFEGGARIRMFRDASDAMRTNSLTISFSKVSAKTMEDCPDPSAFDGQTFDVTPDGCARAFVLFNGCEDNVTARIQGSVTLESFSTGRGERIKGSIQGDLVYAEKISATTETLERTTSLGTVEGEFSFVNVEGAVHRY